MHRVSESWPALASRGATPGREPNIPAPGLGVCVRGRKSLAQLHLRRQCASFCGPKKRIGTAPGFSPEPTLGLSSLARVSSTLQLGGHPVVERFARHRSSVQVWAPLPCGSGGGTLRPLQPRPGVAGTPLRPSLVFGLPAPACAFAFNPPARVAERSAPSFRHGRLLGLRLRTDHFAARRRGDSFCLPLRRLLAFGGTSSLDWSGLTTKPPKRLPMKRFSCRSAFRCCRATSEPFASLKPPPWIWRREAFASWRRPRGSLRLTGATRRLELHVVRVASACASVSPAPSGSCHRARLSSRDSPTLALKVRPPRERDFRPFQAPIRGSRLLNRWIGLRSLVTVPIRETTYRAHRGRVKRKRVDALGTMLAAES